MAFAFTFTFTSLSSYTYIPFVFLLLRLTIKEMTVLLHDLWLSIEQYGDATRNWYGHRRYEASLARRVEGFTEELGIDDFFFFFFFFFVTENYTISTGVGRAMVVALSPIAAYGLEFVVCRHGSGGAFTGLARFVTSGHDGAIHKQYDP